MHLRVTPFPTICPQEGLLFEALSQVDSALVCGGWVRDTLLRRTPNDLDFVVSYPDFSKLDYIVKVRIPDLCPKHNFEFISIECKLTGVLPFAANLGQYALKVSEKDRHPENQQLKVIKFDIKCMFLTESMLGEPKYRDFKLNCLFYDFRTNLALGRAQDFRSIGKREIKPAINMSLTLEDPVRLLRAVRLKHCLGLSYSKKTLNTLLSPQIRNKYWADLEDPVTVQLRSKAPREYRKMLLACETVDILTAVVVDLYTFGWHPAPIIETRLPLEPEIFGRYFQKEYPHIHERMLIWSNWDCKGKERRYLAVALILSVALVSVVRFEGLESEDLVDTFAVFFPESQRARAASMLGTLRQPHGHFLLGDRQLRSYMWTMLVKFGAGLQRLAVSQSVQSLQSLGRQLLGRLSTPKLVQALITF